MKKTISINLGGRAFNIEEDGFLELEKYIEKLKQQFSNDPSVNDLIADIELGIADKFVEYLAGYKQVITREDVEKTISIMGDAEEISGSKETEAESAQSKNQNETANASSNSTDIPKRLYRNSDDMVIGGVCSGLATYLGVDPVIIRILFVVLAFIHGFSILVYLILWVAVPEAQTQTQVLEMRGKATTVEEIQELHKEKKAPEKETTAQKILNAPFIVIKTIFSFLKKIWHFTGSTIRVCFGLFILGISFIALTASTIIASLLLLRINSPYIISDLPLAEMSHNPLFYIGTISAYFLIAIPLFLLILLGIGLIQKKNTIQAWMMSICAILWIFSIGGTTASASELLPWAQTKLDETAKKEQTIKNFTFGDIQKISVGNKIALHVERGTKAQLTIRGRQRAIQEFQAIEDGQHLDLRRISNQQQKLCLFCSESTLEGVMTLPDIRDIELHDQASTHVRGFTSDLAILLEDAAKSTIQLNGQNIRARIQGYDSNLLLSGKANEVIVQADSSGKFQTKNLDATKMQLSLAYISEADLDGKAERADFLLQNFSHLQANTFVVQDIHIKTTHQSEANIHPIQSLHAVSTDFSRIMSLTQVASSTIRTQEQGEIREGEKQQNELE